MSECERRATGYGYLCGRRSQCLTHCRAGWVEEPRPCESCGDDTAGPFLSTIYDDGAELVMFRLLCVPCARKFAIGSGVQQRGLGEVLLMEVPPRRVEND